MKLLLVDNYDSFTYNLAHYFEEIALMPKVVRNDEVRESDLEESSHIIISPGPGLPADAGVILNIINNYSQTKAILGICLGAQAIAQVYGAKLYNQNEVAHGVQRKVYQEESLENWLFKGLPKVFKVGLYHSWAIQPSPKFEESFKPIAYRENGVLMAFEHQSLALAGIQFHPESILTEGGKQMLKNWLDKKT